jgi:integrase
VHLLFVRASVVTPRRSDFPLRFFGGAAATTPRQLRARKSYSRAKRGKRLGSAELRATRLELIIRDPSAALQPHERPTQKAKRKAKRLSPDQLQAVISSAERLTPSFAPVIVLLAYTGMRIREALGLRWENVDLDEATIRLRWQLARDDRTRVPVKTEAGNRDLPIVPALRRRLIAHRLASPWTRPGDPVFAATNGKPKAYRNVRRALEKISDELEIDLASHDFRRSLASFLIIAARADDGAVTGLMGHSDISVTRRLYAADWREADERNEIVLRQLAEAGIGQ